MLTDVDPLWLAQSRLRRRKWDQCADLCSQLLIKNRYDQVTTRVLPFQPLIQVPQHPSHCRQCGT